MQYHLKSPCKDCPFVKGSSTNQTLHEERIPEIISSIRADFEFPCHKTVYSNVDEEHCAGALLFEVADNRVAQLPQVMDRIGIYKLSDIHPTKGTEIISPDDYPVDAVQLMKQRKKYAKAFLM